MAFLICEWFILRDDTICAIPDGFFISQELHGDYRLHILIQLINKWYASREVEVHDGSIGHSIKMLDNATERIAMGSNDDLLARLDLGNDDIVPVWQSSIIM